MSMGKNLSLKTTQDARHNKQVVAFYRRGYGGQLLVATTAADPNFDPHGRPCWNIGATGGRRVLNRLDDPLPIAPVAAIARDRHAAQGGPVDERLIALAQLTESIDGTPIDGAWILLSGGLGTIDLFLDPDEVAAAVAALRVFRGYSGWGSGQLDDELAAGAWMVLPAESSDVFGPNPKDLWRDVLRRQGGRIAWLANAPDDLSAN